MRFKEFSEAATPKDPNWSNGHFVFNEPWEKTKLATESLYMKYIKLPDGSIPPEILALKGPDGLYRVNSVTQAFARQLLSKYKKFPDYSWKELAAGASQTDRDIQDREVGEFRNQIDKALSDANERGAPKSHFFYPNRPYADNALPGFRGTPTGVENTAKRFEPVDINFYMGAYKWAVGQRLVDPISAEVWLMIALTEGRDDFGFNMGQWLQQQGPGDKAFAEQIKKMGLSNPEQIGFVGLIKNKQNLIKRGSYRDFYAAWNGGTANMANFQAQQRAVADPRNKPILDTIKQAIA
jgi:hypothetical protein